MPNLNCSRARLHRLVEGTTSRKSNILGQCRYLATPLSSSTSTPRGSVSFPSTSAYAVFDRKAKQMQKNRAVRRNLEHSRLTDYVRDEVAGNLVDRLLVSVKDQEEEEFFCSCPEYRISRSDIPFSWTLVLVLAML